MARCRLNRLAKADLREVYRYGFFQHGEAQADRYYVSLFKRFDEIADNPLLYPAVNHIREGYRRCSVGAHAIYYRVEGEEVEIVRILGRQDRNAAFP